MKSFDRENGKAELKAVLGELLHNAGEWEAEEEGGASEPRESDPPQWAETKASRGDRRRRKHRPWSQPIQLLRRQVQTESL